jgi:hypothetical protein
MNNENNLICKCNSCDKGFCTAKSACYKAINDNDCKNDECLGCFDEFQEFQVGFFSFYFKSNF